MAQRLLRALSPFRRRSAAQKAQEAKEEEERKGQLLKDKESLEAASSFSRARTDEERKLQAARRKEHEVARAQLFAGREEAPLKANGIHKEEARKGEESRVVGDLPSKARGVGLTGKFRDGGPRENGGLRQENGTGRFRYENGDAERAHMKESLGNFSPVSPLTAAASSSSSSPSLQGVQMNGTSSPLSDRASPPRGGKPKPSEGSFSSPLSGNPLLSTLSELSKNSVRPSSAAQDAGEVKRPLARPLNISFMGSYNRERAESDELKEGARAALLRPRGGAEPEVQKELVKTPAREEVKQTSPQVKQKTPEVKQHSLEVKIPEPVEEPEGPTAHSPFRLTTSPIYMPPEPKVRRPVPPREEPEDEVPWAKDSMIRRGNWASMIMDESTFNLPRIAVRVSSPDTGAGGVPVSPRFASPGVSPRYPNGSRSPRHAAPTRAVRGLKTPEKQPPKTRSPGSFSAPLVRTEPPGGRSPKQGFMRGTASSKVKTANAKEGGRIRTSSTPRKKIQPPMEAKRDDAFAGDKLLDFGASFSPADRGSELFLRKSKQPSSGGRAFSAGDRHARLHRSASFPVVGVTPAEMAELAALKAQLSAALQVPPPSAARRKDPPPESQAATPETLLKSPLRSPLKSLLVKTKSVGGVPEVDLSGGVEEPPAIPADVPLAAEAVFSTPLKSPKSPLKALSGGAVAQSTKSPAAEKSRTASPRRSSSPLRKPVASPKAASPKGPVPSKDAPSPTSARSTSGQTGPFSPSPKSPSVKKPPTGPRNKPVLEVDVPARPSTVTSLLASPGRGSPRSSPSSLHSPASSPSRSPLRTRRASSPAVVSSLMSPTAASLNKAIPGSPRARSQSPSRLSRSQSVGGDEKPPSPRMSAVRSNSLPVNLDVLPRTGRSRRASSPMPGARAGAQAGSEKRAGSLGRAKLKPAVPKREVTKRELGTRRLSDVSSGSSEELVDLGEPTSLLPDDLAPSEEGSQSVSELVSFDGGSGEVPAEEALPDEAADKDAGVVSGEQDDVSSVAKADISKDGAKMVAEAEAKAAVAKALNEAGQGAATKTSTEEAEHAIVGGEENHGQHVPGDRRPTEGGVQQTVAAVETTSAKSDEAAFFAVAKHADVIKVQEAETEAQFEFGDGGIPSAASRGLILEDDSLEMLPGAPLVAASRISTAEGGAESAGTHTVHGRGETKHDSLSEPSAEVGKKHVMSISEKERRRAEVANLLAALQEREEIDYIARLVRRAQREKAQLSRPARPEDDPPSVTSSLDSLGSAGAHFEKGGENVQKGDEASEASTEKGPEAPGRSSQERAEVSALENSVAPEAEGPAGLAGWSKILGASEGGETAVWVEAGARVSDPPEAKATELLRQVAATAVVSRGLPEEPDRGVVQSRPEVGVVKGEKSAGSVSKAEAAPVAGVRDGELESSSSGVDVKEPHRRKESATISMPEKPARGAAEGPETVLWDTYPSPTSPLDFLDDRQDTPEPVAKAASHEKSRFQRASRPDLRKPAVYVETALAHAGLTAPEPHALPEWFSQTEVLNPALFQELERQVDADLLPSGGHRKGATWRLSLDSTALRDAYSRPHTPRKEGFADRRMLFDRMDEVLGDLLAPHRVPPLGKRRLRPLRRGPRGPELVAAVVAKCTEKPPPVPGGDAGFDACSPQGVEELLQKCLPQAQRKWDNFEVEEAEVGVEVEVGILDDLIGEAVQGFIAMAQQKGGRRRVHPVAS